MHARATEGFPIMSPTPQPDPADLVVLYVGQDVAGHWLVQDAARLLEGRFVSLTAALRFAEAERQMYHASVRLATMPLVPVIPFGPVAADVRALPRAA